jgi:hypothetical protein
MLSMPAEIETHALAMLFSHPTAHHVCAHAPHDRASIVFAGRRVPVHHLSRRCPSA